MSELGDQCYSGEQFKNFVGAIQELGPLCVAPEGELLEIEAFEHILDSERVALVIVTKIDEDEDLGIEKPTIGYGLNIIDTTYCIGGEVRVSKGLYVYVAESEVVSGKVNWDEVTYAEETSYWRVDENGERIAVPSPMVEKLIKAAILDEIGEEDEAITLTVEAHGLFLQAQMLEGILGYGETATYLGYMAALGQINEDLGLAAA